MHERFTFDEALAFWSKWDDFSQANNLRGKTFLDSLRLAQIFHWEVAKENGFSDVLESIPKISFDYVLGENSRKAFVKLYKFIKKHQPEAASLSIELA